MVGAAGFEPATPAVCRQFGLQCITSSLNIMALSSFYMGSDEFRRIAINIVLGFNVIDAHLLDTSVSC